MIVLGIDPGTAALGYGVISRNGGLRAVDYGVLSTGADLPLPERLLAVHTLMTDLIELHAPSLIGVERLFFSRNAQTAFAVGQARGVVLLAAAQSHVPVREATPSEVKVAVTGYGAADKEQVGRMVTVILQLPEVPHPDDTADALAVAICIANSERTVERRAAAAGSAAGAAVLDRAAIAPIARGETPYERAVREALAAADVRTGGKPRPTRSAG